ncbi:amidase [Sneathiella sp. CAU 1612]|uniref:Amidase n=1 Tax=Sneathiella sedimenti TaxID=2816034 RepID=A0ABS3F9Z4_9PROT|nr:amidase [Sneathiella sedimenti]MBO0335153.1 amidase [Sneathiella sedimenti]
MTVVDQSMPNVLPALDAVRQIRDGRLTSVELVRACLNRIEETDGQIKAWAQLDPDYAFAQAAEMDSIRRAGRPLGTLHGIPVGLKDIVDTRDFLTERGTPIFAGRQPAEDAAIVERLRDQGAIILGKTVTTELAFVQAVETRNPHNVAHSPGGSSSGSAAAVAAFQVPLAIGTQTNGSVIRPASFCGTYGFKPTRGMISRRGILQTSKSLDQVGVFGRTLEDVAALSDVIKGYDPADHSSYARPRPLMLEGCRADPPVDPEFVWLELPFNNRLTPAAREGLEEIMALLGDRVDKVSVPASFDGFIEAQRVIHEFEICQHLQETFSGYWEKISPALQQIVEHGRTISAAQYEDAVQFMVSANEYFDVFFHDYDAVLTASAPGEASEFVEGTGDPVFSTIWTLCGLPSVSLPLLVGETGLPIGVQLVARTEQDDRLFRTANWIQNKLKAQQA